MKKKRRSPIILAAVIIILVLVLAVVLTAALLGRFGSHDDGRGAGSAETPTDAPTDALTESPAEPETEALTEPVTEPVTEAVEIRITDAVSYEKAVIAVPEIAAMGWEAGDLMHTVRIPKLEGASGAVAEFNDKIYNESKSFYETLLADEEYNQIYSVDYRYKIYNGLVGIVVVQTRGVQAGGGDASYRAYYFDAEKGVELTLDEYLQAFSLERASLLGQIKESDEYEAISIELFVTGEITLTDCLIGEDGITAYLGGIDNNDGFTWLDVESVTVTLE